MVGLDMDAVKHLKDLHARRPWCVRPTSVTVGVAIGLLHNLLPLLGGGFVVAVLALHSGRFAWPSQALAKVPRFANAAWALPFELLVAAVGVCAAIGALGRRPIARRILEASLALRVIGLPAAAVLTAFSAERLDPETLLVVVPGVGVTGLMVWGLPAFAAVFLLEQREGREWYSPGPS